MKKHLILWGVVAIAAVVLVGCCCNSCSKGDSGKKHHRQRMCPKCQEQCMETVTVEAVEIIPVAPANSTADKNKPAPQAPEKKAAPRNAAPAAAEKSSSAM